MPTKIRSLSTKSSNRANARNNNYFIFLFCSKLDTAWTLSWAANLFKRGKYKLIRMIGIIMLQQSIKTSFKVVIVLRYRNVRTNFINEKPKIRRKKGILISIMYQVFLLSSFDYYQDKLYTQVLLHIFTLSLCVIFFWIHWFPSLLCSVSITRTILFVDTQ